MIDIWALLARVIIGGSAIYHVLIGIFSMLSVDATRKAMKAFYSLNFPDKLDPRFNYAMKPLGAFGVVFGVISYYAISGRNLEFFHFFELALALLLFLRGLLRVIYSRLLQEAFQVSFSRSLYNIFFNAVLVMILLTDFMRH